LQPRLRAGSPFRSDKLQGMRSLMRFKIERTLPHRLWCVHKPNGHCSCNGRSVCWFTSMNTNGAGRLPGHENAVRAVRRSRFAHLIGRRTAALYAGDVGVGTVIFRCRNEDVVTVDIHIVRCRPAPDKVGMRVAHRYRHRPKPMRERTCPHRAVVP